VVAVLPGKCSLFVPVRQSTVKEALAKSYEISWDTSKVAVRHVQGRYKLGLVLLEAGRPTIHDLLCRQMTAGQQCNDVDRRTQSLENGSFSTDAGETDRELAALKSSKQTRLLQNLQSSCGRSLQRLR
jgi:hypothetical protein